MKKEEEERKEIQPRCSQVMFKREKIVQRGIGIRLLKFSFPFLQIFLSITYSHPLFASPTFTSFPPHHTHAPLDQCDL
jgi:hypothetical protein